MKRVLIYTQTIVLTVVALWLAQQFLFDESPLELSGTQIDPPKSLSDIGLIDHNGNAFKLAGLEGKWILVFLGYTHCPDVCPTTLAYLTREYAELRELRPQVQVVFVSVDPKRDNPGRLKKYVKHFDTDFIGATGEYAQLKLLSKDLGVYFSKQESDSDAGYLMTHSSDIFLINPNGDWTGLYRPPFKQGELSTDLSKLILRRGAI